MEDGNQQLLRDQEATAMEGRNCHGGYSGEHALEAGAAERDPFSLVPPLQRKPRLRRSVRLLCTGVALLVVGAVLTVSLVVGLSVKTQESPCHNSTFPDVINNSERRLSHPHDEFQEIPSAMVTVPASKKIDQGYLHWDCNQSFGKCFLKGKFTYSNRSLVVPVPGIYRVFLQIAYEYNFNNRCCDSNDDLLILSNSVECVDCGYDNPIVLLSSFDTGKMCGMLRKTLYTAGLFALGAGYKLSVKSDHQEYIANKEHQVFFGAELSSLMQPHRQNGYK
ncbi:lymphotoxin-alpha [Pholidichthys leucotaenia]